MTSKPSAAVISTQAAEIAQPREVWAYVAHKNGRWRGVASAEMGAGALKDFLGDFVATGYDITRVYDRAEYEALLKTLSY